MKSRAALLLLLLSLQICSAAQQEFISHDFSRVDSFVTSIKYQDDFSKLINDLTQPFPDDIDKIRAIFRWITNNISFDYRFVNQGRELNKPDCFGENDCPEQMMQWENNYLRKILRTQKAIAEGYSKLFKKMCDFCYIQCEAIPGYARTKPYQVGNNMGVNHWWDAVLIDRTWYYLDPTWAAGYCTEDEETGMLLRYVKDYKEYYWLQTFEPFSRNHYPQNGKWVEKPSITKEQFFNRPHYFSVETLANIREHTPLTGVIKLKKGDSIHFDFDYEKDIGLIQVNSNIFRNPPLWTTINTGRRKTKLVRDTWAEKKQQYILFTRNGNNYQFDFVVKDNSLYYLELVFDYKPAIRYRVRVEN
ncbi:MAG: hypothetical protein JST02_12945 [Bacteroidetes bacterium]|nr:hypothetical protein [Bacteroidota bacterium]